MRSGAKAKASLDLRGRLATWRLGKRGPSHIREKENGPMISLVDLQAQYRTIRLEIDAAIEQVVANASFILGEEVREFEEAFAAYCGVRYCIGVSSGTAALRLALEACGVGPGDEVITSPHTFVATAEAICHKGARPVFADIDPVSYNLDPAQVEQMITAKTKAILPVHLYGQPADMDSLLEIARRRDLKVIEDAAQAHGAEYRGSRVGGLGEAACFSFYPAKNLGAYGDAGAVVTNDPRVAESVRMLRDHGRHSKYEHKVIGFGERLDALQAAVLSVKLRHLDEWNDQRRQVALLYREMLDGYNVPLPEEMHGVRHVYHLFVVRVPNRDAAIAKLKEAGIEAGVHYPVPLHLQPAFSWLGYREGDFPNAEQAAREVLSLPTYPELTEGEISRVVEALMATVGL